MNVAAVRAVFSDDVTQVGWRVARRLYFLGLLTLGLVSIRPVLGFTVSDWLFLAALIVTLPLALLRRARFEPGLPRLLVAGAALMIAGGLVSSVLAAQNTGGSLAVVARLAYLLFAWFWLGRVLLTEPDDLRTAILLWTASAAIDGLGAIAQLFFGDIIPGASIGMGRMSGFTQHVNDLGAVAALALVPALAVTAERRWGAVPWGAVAAILVTVGLLLSGSVGAFVAAAAALLVWSLRGERRAFSALLLGLGVLLTAALIIAAPLVRPTRNPLGQPAPLERVVRVAEPEGEPGSGSLWIRVEGYRQAAVRIAAQPIVGVGHDPASARTANGISVHNFELGAWYEAGLLALAGALLILVALARIALTFLRWPRSSRLRDLGVGLAAATAAFAVYVQGAPIDTQRYAWIGPALLLVVEAHAARWRAGDD
ncbi:MAG TPA: O-antigen ligase family protein [Candidatus Limnocylindrales bacterium]|nr:O-antigen ligase family protein [Candidatus Limnocylindrales bacterium]